jgi:hypothetical protein
METLRKPDTVNLESLNGRDELEDLEVNGRIIFKWVVEEGGGGVGSIVDVCLAARTGDGLL